MSQGLSVRPRTVLVEGTTDVALFEMAARLEQQATGAALLGPELAIIAAGVGDLGGTRGVIRELHCLRGLARGCLLPNGRPRYRFIGLFDNDKAGRQAVAAARDLDSSIIEYKDVFRLWPVMAIPGNLDPGTVGRAFEHENATYKGLDWELEDFLPGEFFEAFMADYPTAVSHSKSLSNKVHRDLTRDGKAHLHRFIKQHAVHADLAAVVEALKAIRHYFNLPVTSVSR